MEERERTDVKDVAPPDATSSKNDDVSVSSDDALCEFLGITSLDTLSQCVEDTNANGPMAPQCCRSVEDLRQVPDSFIQEMMDLHKVQEEYSKSNFCFFPDALAVPAGIMRQLCNELVWRTDDVGEVDRTFECIKYASKEGLIQERSTLTRLENLNGHPGWYQLCNHYIPRCLSVIMGGEDMNLYKTKLNLKPPGGSGFAPHVDAPSLLVPFGDHGPQTFVTVMIAIDDMTPANGCLRIAKGSDWTCAGTCPIILPEAGANPDAGGRAGAIPLDVASRMEFTDVTCTAGTVCAFGGWVPHRSGVNQTLFSRRAVFLTYNPSSQGDFYDLYYCKMKQLRNAWRDSRRCAASRGSIASCEENSEMESCTTIPQR